ncbi:MAG: alkaline phosphatase family protein [Planctomycetes bacterium]|nr:alkaline phosphatase family protein [Planctomycetota bacterium]
MSQIEKVAIIGLDCAEPSLVFEKWADDLPNLSRLVDGGLWGKLESCLPPITVPAWSCMATSKDPGTLGIYGFRNRKDHSYDGLGIATNLAVREPRLWDYLGAKGKKVIAVGVPQTFPIVRPPNGCQVTSFLTPDINSNYTHPPGLKQEIAELVGEYMLDVKGFRTDNKQWLLDQIYEMTDKRFKVCNHLLQTKPWDLFWMVEMGTDRIHHGFWQYIDKDHHRYKAGNQFENSIHDYYVHIDKLIGELLGVMDLEKTAVWVVSDHGAKRMDGGFCFNDWLIREGLLVMKEPVSERRKFNVADVDWSKTKVWGEGGYYGRCFINVAGREPEGIVPESEYGAFRDELKARIEGIVDHKHRPMGNVAHRPEDIYRQVNRVAPDLLVIFGDLHWRSVGTIGNPDVYTFENDTGPDDANHAQQGMYILSHPSLPSGRRDATLYDVTPTTLKMMGQNIPPDLVGHSLA